MIESRWRKSTHSGNQGDCVEVDLDALRTRVRDSKDRDGGMLQLPTTAWDAFTVAVRARH